MIRMARGVLGAVLLASAGWIACSNDVELPSAYHRDLLDQPTQVEAALDAGVLTVTWQLASAAGVAGFVVEVVDPTGMSHTRPASDPAARSLEVDDLSFTAGDVYLVRVWAVDALDATAFSGPASVADSLVAE